MIIDVHGHYTTSPPELNAFRGQQISSMGRPVARKINISDDSIHETLQQGQLGLQREWGIDTALFSPTAGAMGHHFGDQRTSLHWTQASNDLIHRVCQLYPSEFIGVGQLPQSPGVGFDACISELERIVNEYGFVGCNVNPDPTGGVGVTPPLGDHYWYPLYEKLVELDVPAMLHVSASMHPGWHSSAVYYLVGDTAAVFQLLESQVFVDFPTLKLIVPHGGGALPAQVARWRASQLMAGREPFEQAIRRLYFDTTLYSREGIEMLIRAVGVDNVLFSTEMIGAAHVKDPDTGAWVDNTLPYVQAIEWLSDEDRYKIYEGNARRVYSRLSGRLAETGR